MPPLPQLPVGDILVIAGNFVFMAWPLLIISTLAGRRHTLANALIDMDRDLYRLGFHLHCPLLGTGHVKGIPYYS